MNIRDINFLLICLTGIGQGMDGTEALAMYDDIIHEKPSVPFMPLSRIYDVPSKISLKEWIKNSTSKLNETIKNKSIN